MSHQRDKTTLTPSEWAALDRMKEIIRHQEPQVERATDCNIPCDAHRQLLEEAKSFVEGVERNYQRPT